jgi:hypothetical protein
MQSEEEEEDLYGWRQESLLCQVKTELWLLAADDGTVAARPATNKQTAITL